ncbi:MAG: hypothetical protein IPL32_13610 [Chloracidobacterium sp.]|nr:hypothetical protein [Chloracidobacterium sp.]
MRSNVLQKILLPAAIIIAGFAAVFFLSDLTTNARPQLPDDYADSDLTINGSKLKGFAFGMEGLIADMYFTRSLQYIGDKVAKSKSDFINVEDLRDLNPRLLYPLLKNATDVDPHFIAAYSFGAMIMPAIDAEKAVELASTGIANNPNEWRLYQHLGYIYWRLGQYEKASEIYEKGSQIEGAASFMKIMAASMKTKGGSRETARAIYRHMLEGAEDEQTRITAERRLKEIDSFDERDAVDRILAEFKERSGRCANNLAEIFPMLATIKLPSGKDFRINKANQLVDPTDAPYILDKNSCVITLDIERTGLPDTRTTQR